MDRLTSGATTSVSFIIGAGVKMATADTTYSSYAESSAQSLTRQPNASGILHGMHMSHGQSIKSTTLLSQMSSHLYGNRLQDFSHF